MGTSMTFYSIQNRGLSVEDLIAGLAALDKTLIATEEKINERLRRLGVDNKMLIRRHDNPFVAFCESSKWLPMFQEGMCAGCNASNHDMAGLSRCFNAPVISFSIFDSDILYLSYSDEANGIAFDYVKPNSSELDGCDTPVYSESYPEFLQILCDESQHQRLRYIWESAEYYMADNRYYNLKT